MPDLFGEELRRRELERRTGRLDAVGGILPYELTDGRARGIRALDLITGSGFRATRLVDRTLDLPRAEWNGMPLCWQSENGYIHPAYYDPPGDEWLRTFFGGLLTTCGLTSFGPGGTDRFGTVGLHGRINCTPASNVRRSERWEGSGRRLEIDGTRTGTMSWPDCPLPWRSLPSTTTSHLQGPAPAASPA